MLKKTDPSPLLPESDEDRGVGTGTSDLRRARRDPRPRRRWRLAAVAVVVKRRRNRSTRTARSSHRADRFRRTAATHHRGARRAGAAIRGSASRRRWHRVLPGSGAGAGPGGRRRRRRTASLSLCDRRAAPFVQRRRRYEISADRRKLLYRAGGGGGAAVARRRRWHAPAPQLFLVDADRNPPQPGQGRLNVALRMYLEPKEEFKQIFNEGWRNQRDYLYVPNMHGADWPKMKQMYGQLLPYVMHRADLNYLLDNMGAEIAVGHSYVRGGDMPTVPQHRRLLGADFAIENGRYKVTRIYDNESWNPDLRAPLATPASNVNVGDYILAINGIELSAPDNIYRLLDGTANRQTR